jgi:hypothetical protein
VSHLQEALRDSKAEITRLEARVEDLDRRREDAVATLFRLRPQRKECTETEVKEDYLLLKDSIENWVEKNCESFLDNEQLGCDRIGGDIPLGYECILNNFRSQPNRWDDAKDQVLVAVIMRYVFDNILCHSFPVWLHGDHKVLLHDIEKAIENLEPKRGQS